MFKKLYFSLFFIISIPVNAENVVLILMDDMGYGYLKSNFDAHDRQKSPDIVKRDGKNYPYEEVGRQFDTAMPVLNSMVDNGIHFTDAYTTSSLCGPSRLSILTGKNNANFGVYNNIDVNQGGLPKDIPWPVGALSNHYHSIAIGKWHAKSHRFDLGDDPITAGFDQFFGFNGHGTDYYNSVDIHRYNPQTNEYINVPQQPKEYLTDVFTEETISAIEEYQFAKPLFLYLSYNAVHGPLGLKAPSIYQDKFSTGREKADIILAYLNAVDVGIKKIQESLKAKGELENTVFLFLADNGSPGGEAQTFPGNSPFKGFKGQILNGGLRIPMIAYQKDKTKGMVYGNPVSSMDMMATVMAYAGMDPQAHGLDGRSLIEIINGNSEVTIHKNLFVVGQNAVNFSYIEPVKGETDRVTAPGAWMVRNKKWVLFYTADKKYVKTAVRSTGGEHYGLYRATDIHLKDNLISKKVNVADRMKREFREWFVKNQADPVRTADHIWWEEVNKD
jgi:uncharacterized sulfatase